MGQDQTVKLAPSLLRKRALSWERLRRDAASNLKARCAIQHHPVWLARDVDRAREAKVHAQDEFGGGEFLLSTFRASSCDLTEAICYQP
jgi:hypothetical protein